MWKWAQNRPTLREPENSPSGTLYSCDKSHFLIEIILITNRILIKCNQVCIKKHNFILYITNRLKSALSSINTWSNNIPRISEHFQTRNWTKTVSTKKSVSMEVNKMVPIIKLSCLFLFHSYWLKWQGNPVHAKMSQTVSERVNFTRHIFIKFFTFNFITCTIQSANGSRTCWIGLVNQQKIKVAERKWHCTFLCAEHFYFHEQHLFSCVNPLLFCYRVLNMGRVAIFDVFWSFLCLWSQIWYGAQPTYKMKCWQCWDLIIPYRFLWDSFCKHGVPLVKKWKFDFFYVKKCREITHQLLASCFVTSNIVLNIVTSHCGSRH